MWTVLRERANQHAHNKGATKVVYACLYDRQMLLSICAQHQAQAGMETYSMNRVLLGVCASTFESRTYLRHRKSVLSSLSGATDRVFTTNLKHAYWQPAGEFACHLVVFTHGVKRD